jgi:ABC-type glutathione transport system ATPase component
VCDEPVSALDVSVQAQVINLLRIFNASASSRTCSSLTICRRKAYVGSRRGDVSRQDRGTCSGEDLYREPMMPYTQALLSAVPVADPKIDKTRILLKATFHHPRRRRQDAYSILAASTREGRCMREDRPAARGEGTGALCSVYQAATKSGYMGTTAASRRRESSGAVSSRRGAALAIRQLDPYNGRQS